MVFRNLVMVCISSVTEKEALHPVHKRDSILFIGSASLLPNFHGYLHQAKRGTFVCLLLWTYTQLHSKSHILQKDNVTRDLVSKLLTVRL